MSPVLEEPAWPARYSLDPASSDAAIDQRSPGRDDERDEVRQWHLPEKRHIPAPGDESITLIDGDQHGPHDEGDERGALEEWSIAHRTQETLG
jgi:hypothetical protein